MFTLDTEAGRQDIILAEGTYPGPETLRVEALRVDGGAVAGPLDDLTVNLDPHTGFGEQGAALAYLDTCNTFDARRMLEEGGAARPTGRTACRGFCSYPLYRWNVSAFYAD